ncbi:hypothetical protein N9X28_00470 [Candidatus Poseidoniales archaeon]|nr:hypothetical protein [Candidatus Poseidoniales archaeon]
MDEISNDTVVKVLNLLTNDAVQFTSDLKARIRTNEVSNEASFQANLHSLLTAQIRGDNAIRCRFNVDIEQASPENPTYSDIKCKVLRTDFEDGEFIARRRLLAWIELKFYYQERWNQERQGNIIRDIQKAKDETEDGGEPIMIVCTHVDNTWEQKLTELDEDDFTLIHFKV